MSRTTLKPAAAWFAFLLASWLFGASASARDDEAVQTDSDEYDELYFDEYADEDGTGDPWEPMNRGIFRVNDGLFRYAIEPVSKAWDYVLPDVVQRSLRNAFLNLRFPIAFFNDLFQWKPKAAGQDLARFVVNSSVGIGGLLDPAGTIGLEMHNEDFGQTLGYWGVPPGPYLVLPFFGPSGVRDGCGLIVDSGFRALGFFIPFWASIAMQGVDTLNQVSLIREQIESERRAALDWYSAVRSAYTQHRESLIQDKRGAAEERAYFPGARGSQDEP